MTAHHHPADDLLLAHAAGSLSAGAALLVAVHLEHCSLCRRRVRALEALGGQLMLQLPPATLAPQALERTLAALDQAPAPTPATTAAQPGPRPPSGMAWPAAFRGCTLTPWRWLGPGMRFSRVTLPQAPAQPDYQLTLLFLAQGRFLPEHSHGDSEMTQVLFGAYHDGLKAFAAGDFDHADGGVQHRPQVVSAQGCICLSAVRGRLLFKGFWARSVAALTGL